MAQADSTIRVDVGTLIAGTYEITKLLGRGGMGTVWEASHARLPGKKVAIKVLHPEVAKDQESLARFRREAEIASRIGHPNICDVHDFNELEDGTPYLILEHLEGISLEDRMAQGPVSEEEVISLVQQIGSALRAAHAEDVIHRDLKPANVFLARTTDVSGNETARARVLDFGISKIRGSATVQTQDSTILGTPQYMAPEQAVGNHSAVDQRTDVFALGSIVYEMLAGRPAFDGQTIPEVVFKVVYEEPAPLDRLCAASPGVIAAVHQALTKKQEERFQSVEEFIEALSGTTLSVRSAPVPSAVHKRQDAENLGLASTMASGNHPGVPGLGQSGTGGPSLGTAATIDSGRLNQASLGLGHAAHSPVSQSAVVPTSSPAAKSGAGALKVALALALILAVAGAGIAFWALSRGTEETSTASKKDRVATADQTDAAVKTAEAPVAIDAAPAVRQPDAGTTDPAAVKAAALAKKKKELEKAKREKERLAKEKLAKETAKTTATIGAGDKPPTAGVDEPNADYDEARKQLNSNPRRTIRLIRRAIGNTNGGRPRFFVLLAKAHCKLKDLTKLNSTLNKLSANRKRDVIAYCKRVWPGYE